MPLASTLTSVCGGSPAAHINQGGVFDAPTSPNSMILDDRIVPPAGGERRYEARLLSVGAPFDAPEACRAPPARPDLLGVTSTGSPAESLADEDTACGTARGGGQSSPTFGAIRLHNENAQCAVVKELRTQYNASANRPMTSDDSVEMAMAGFERQVSAANINPHLVRVASCGSSSSRDRTPSNNTQALEYLNPGEGSATRDKVVHQVGTTHDLADNRQLKHLSPLLAART